MSPDLRRESAEAIGASDPPGFALGGFSMGEPAAQMDEMVAYTASLLPEAKPRYLMGVGMPRDILAAVKAGVDMFDCILPTRMGRTAMAFTSEGLLRLRNAKFARDERPLDPECDGVCCRSYSRAYLRHCFAVDEMLGPKLLSLHNVRYYGRLMRTLRRSILEGTLEKVMA
jgi:queuine tRNA-ribosyltransferase